MVASGAMDPLLSGVLTGGAGLIGAAIGGFFAYRGAVRGAKEGREAEQERWRRDRREQAYLGFLTARNRYVRLMVEQGDAMQEAARNDAWGAFDFDPWLKRLAPIWVEIEEALATVELFGSSEAREQVRDWLPILRTNYGMATRPGGAFGAGVRAVEQDEIKDQRDRFMDLVRSELRIGD
jgi:hypothetical protein